MCLRLVAHSCDWGALVGFYNMLISNMTEKLIPVEFFPHIKVSNSVLDYTQLD